MTTWGLSATILAPTTEILRFAAHHLDAGAHRLYIYLDDDNLSAFNTLKSHPKVRVQTCNTAHWKRLGVNRPVKHQARQTLNATHAYARKAEVDWLIHMDVDEFLVPQTNVAEPLAELPATTTSARVRPMELLGGSDTAFKTFLPPGRKRNEAVKSIYPTFGQHLKGGFLSHVAGKLFVRTGLPEMEVRIHNAFRNGTMLPDAAELTEIDLAHCHATSWDAWHRAYAYRIEKGSYRAELKPATQGTLSLHALLRKLEADQGEAGLRTFYDEVIGNSDDLRARLRAHDALRIVDLDLAAKVARHFPDAPV
ncbi:glycosyltransferase family 2 protein [Tateyamaria omphalii]|uniref:glycosyltransferase family 2 protein n=1 Tax=Tateyamaria omphalii TaxID=299262 RepID=UPI001C99A08E|nr:glycosyltransferase family 2 protein [Tateyamaria omphalii]MBY5932255.1 glycosyltransferase family 2 protein [Tateyamaria omphalii]